MLVLSNALARPSKSQGRPENEARIRWYTRKATGLVGYLSVQTDETKETEQLVSDRNWVQLGQALR